MGFMTPGPEEPTNSPRHGGGEPPMPDPEAVAFGREVVVPWPGRRSWTRADLDALPADGRRYELIDGVLVVSPTPGTRHQVMSGQLFLLFSEACASVPELGLMVLAAPLNVVLADDSLSQPDLVVAPQEQFDDRGLPGAPLLVVEILSRSTRAFDLHVKRERYERAGVEHYWIADPDKPSLTTLRLQGGQYVEQGRAVGPQSLHVSEPFEMLITPSRLVFPTLRGVPGHVVTDDVVAAFRDDDEPRDVEEPCDDDEPCDDATKP